MNTQHEINGWNSHRARQRKPLVKAPPPLAKRRKSKREKSTHDMAIHEFTVAMAEAEKHRHVLRRRFGYTDKQIGLMALVHQRQLDRRG